MIVQDVTTFARSLTGDGTTGIRFTDAQLISYVDRAQKLIVRDLKWPPSRFVFTTTSTVQEYQLQEVIKILAVYINGQPLVRTDKATLEGRQIQFYDQTGSGGGPGGLVVPNQAPVLAGANYTPQWTSQTASTYPVPSSLGYPAPDAAPWMPGQRPRYYCNGGSIGFVPAPLGALKVVCDVIAQPVTLQTLADALMLPDIALDALSWKVIELMYFSDKETGADQRNYALTEYTKALGELRSWKRGYDGSGPKGPKPLTVRSFYVKGRNKL